MTPSTNGKSTPFLDVSSFELPELELDTVAEAESFSFMGSPFISSYAYNESEVLVDSEAEEYAEFLSELYDEEFNDALFEIAAEAAEVYETFMESEYGNTAAYQREAMRRLEAHFEPLIAETENMLESMASAADQHDMRRMSEPEIEAFISNLQAEFRLGRA